MIDERFMLRALELAEYGAGFVSPNPMVGAVIVASDGKIIGEGWHAKYGGPHAEVNAVASVRAEDQMLIPQSTIYVSLEPCSHYGKTPPCSKLLIEKGFRRVVVGMRDPFKEVSGRGIAMLRKAGIEVIENVLEKECRHLNRRFITAHTLHRPYIQLKWAQSADGYIAAINALGEGIPIKLSNPLGMVEMHKERAMTDAILVGTNTVLADNPSLTTRLWSGRSPRPVIFSSPRIPANAKIMSRNPIILDGLLPLDENMRILYSNHGITSLMVEGGTRTLHGFIAYGLFDSIRIETSADCLGHGIPAPTLPANLYLTNIRHLRKNTISIFEKTL